jgi:two-component system LytT family sensor kinase
MHLILRRTDKIILFLFHLFGYVLACGFTFFIKLDLLLFFIVTISIQELIYLQFWGRFKVKIPKYASWGNSPETRLRSELWLSLFTGLFFTVMTLLSIFLFQTKLVITLDSALFILVSFILWAIFVNIGGEFLHVYFSVKHAQKKIEQNKSEVIKLRKEVLQDLISPHFLFNSLNTVSSVITENKAKSIRFVKEVSDLYKFMLTDSHKVVISLKEDMLLAQKYAFLLKTRLEDGVNIVFHIPDLYHRCILPPMTVQNLVENCVKHNVVSKRSVLRIDVFIGGSYLIVKNNLNLKMNSGMGSTNLGLNYIISQFEQLSDEEVVIVKTKDEFIVKIPLIYEETRKIIQKKNIYSAA